MIQLRGVTKKYKNQYALKNINLDIMAGEFVFLTGPSGAGKSTLLKLLYREEQPTCGVVMLANGINVAKLPDERVPNLRRCMGIVGLTDKMHAKPSELSGGEQQRVSIARAIINGPRILIADEPTGNLDPKTSMEVMQILEQINQRNVTVLVSTHDQALVNHFRKRVITLENGQIVRDIQAGTYE